MIHEDTKQKRLLCCGILTFCSLIVIFSRLHTYNEPLERDITFYEIAGNELLLGKSLYSGIWDHKPPAPAVTHAVAIAIAGYGEGSVYLLGVLAAIITLLGVYSAGKALAGNSAGGLWGALFWAVISGDLYLQANQPNVEVFINAVLIWAFAIMLRSDGRSSAAMLRWFWIGILFALGSLYKPNVIAPAILLSFVHVVCAAPGRHGRGRAVAQVAVAGLAGASAWCLVFAYFFFQGSIGDFIYAVFTFNKSYSGSVGSNLLNACSPPAAWPKALHFTWPLALLGLAAAAHEIVRGERRRWLLFIALCASAHVMVAMPGRFFPHYYQYWLPVLALGGGAAIGLFMNNLKTGGPSSASVLGIMVMIVLLCHEAPFYMLSAEEWSRRKYRHPDEDFIGARDCGREINAMLSEREKFYEWGSDTGLYFYSARRPPAGVFFHYALGYGSRRDVLEKRLLAQLEAEKPDLFVINVYNPISNAILGWVQANYAPCAQKPCCKGFAFFVRRGSGLERRLASEPSLSDASPENATQGGG